MSNTLELSQLYIFRWKTTHRFWPKIVLSKKLLTTSKLVQKKRKESKIGPTLVFDNIVCTNLNVLSSIDSNHTYLHKSKRQFFVGTALSTLSSRMLSPGLSVSDLALLQSPGGASSRVYLCICVFVFVYFCICVCGICVVCLWLDSIASKTLVELRLVLSKKCARSLATTINSD